MYKPGQDPHIGFLVALWPGLLALPLDPQYTYLQFGDENDTQWDYYQD